MIYCLLDCINSKRIVLFRSTNLRSIDHPSLDYAIEKGDKFDCLFLNERIFDENDVYFSYIDSATKDLSSRLKKKNLELKTIDGDADKLISYINSEYKNSKPEIVWANSPIAPFASFRLE